MCSERSVRCVPAPCESLHGFGMERVPRTDALESIDLDNTLEDDLRSSPESSVRE